MGKKELIPLSKATMERHFPALKFSKYVITSPATITYNCIAWAADDSETWWWPDPFGIYFWPAEIPREETIESFVKAFELLGFQVCSSREYESDYEKIAIFATPNGKPTHAAKQFDSEMWSSKLGKLEDILHNINSLSGRIYGEPVIYMKRPKK
jgi:hypothetical protein